MRPSKIAKRPSKTAKSEAVAVAINTDTTNVIGVQSEGQRVVLRVSLWAGFGVFFGLLPLFAIAIKELYSDSGFHINHVLGTGELFVVAAVLAAGAMGDWIASAFKRHFSLKAMWAFFFCLVGFAGNTMAYMQASNAQPSMIVVTSAWFFLPSLLASGVCVGMAAR